MSAQAAEPRGRQRRNEADPDDDGPPGSQVLNFGYDGETTRINVITEPGGITTRFEYDLTGRVRKINYPDGTTKTIKAPLGAGLVDFSREGFDSAHPVPYPKSGQPTGSSTDALGQETEEYRRPTRLDLFKHAAGRPQAGFAKHDPRWPDAAKPSGNDKAARQPVVPRRGANFIGGRHGDRPPSPDQLRAVSESGCVGSKRAMLAPS